MKNLFIDLGTHMGSGVLAFIKMYNMTPDTWNIHTFEPQPILYALAGTNTTATYAGYPYSFKDINEALSIFPSIVRHNAAASTNDGTASLYFEKAPEEMHMGSTINTNVSSNNSRDFSGQSTQVKTIDIYKFIQNQIGVSNIDLLVIKVDIEGAEFEVLNKFLDELSKNNLLNANKIEVYCEFHHRCLPNHGSGYPSVKDYQNEFSKYNITLHEWH